MKQERFERNPLFSNEWRIQIIQDEHPQCLMYDSVYVAQEGGGVPFVLSTQSRDHGRLSQKWDRSCACFFRESPTTTHRRRPHFLSGRPSRGSIIIKKRAFFTLWNSAARPSLCDLLFFSPRDFSSLDPRSLCVPNNFHRYHLLKPTGSIAHHATSTPYQTGKCPESEW